MFGYDFFKELFSRFGQPDIICADSWRMSELKSVMSVRHVPVFGVRTGFKSGDIAVRHFRKLLYSGKIRCEQSTLVREQLAECILVTDPSGNQKLSKCTEAGRRSRHKDDNIAAMLVGCYFLSQRQEQPPQKIYSISRTEGIRTYG